MTISEFLYLISGVGMGCGLNAYFAKKQFDRIVKICVKQQNELWGLNK